uniref:Alpha-type protein kinase domain-containing protein n=1 Tax=Knipowitschia caucasica TaxID=637954 RepID=A0AAV2MSH1_KNICA
MMKGTLSKSRKLQSTRDRKWSKSSDFAEDKDSEEQSHYKKTVKIQENLPRTSLQSELSEACWRRPQRFKGESRRWSASASLSQLNPEPTDLLQRQMDLWSPTHSAWNSWSKSVRRSSVQSVPTSEVRTSSFQSSENLYPHYSAMERNNLMRLAHDVLFTPVSLMGGEEVSIYTLDEDPSECAASWSSQGLSAILQPLTSEEGSLYGGLRQGCRVLCTWAERDILMPGEVYVVKAFYQEVVRAWQRYFHGSTALQLCLREIQQQRAAQRMMKVFNQIKPEDHMPYSPHFLDVMLVLWHSNGQWLTIERNIPGDFRKFNHNTGEEIASCSPLEEMLLAFSHWTFEYSGREMLVLDIQGVGEALTDPTVIMADNHSDGRDGMLFGADNLGEAAISVFLRKHVCNACCRRLGLTDLRRHSTGRSESAESTSADEENSSDGSTEDL